MYTPAPNDDLQSHVRNTADPYNANPSGNTGRGGLIALLMIVVVIGGIVVLSSIAAPPAQAPTPAQAPAPESITGGTTAPAE
ncbi:hypothetical protein C6W92_04710 [Roseovarius sp. A46]|jgi:hypothetical protein|uniref:hypothetical protein n=1 Tax=Roseovarius sp. A46 TaxID=2109331 RepID=UPI001012DA31|nr:hypothetical protein [Roseovarius sp. A46]RXV66463.1 hypothetical protein C6W92_04710 [Roseovarius sp. A46]